MERDQNGTANRGQSWLTTYINFVRLKDLGQIIRFFRFSPHSSVITGEGNKITIFELGQGAHLSEVETSKTKYKM